MMRRTSILIVAIAIRVSGCSINRMAGPTTASGTFRKCDLRRARAAFGSKADSGKPP